MLKQITLALSKLHSLGYSHCDLKMENICARIDQNNKLQFTLIDFGVCSKLGQQQKISDRKGFRGNFVFSSFDHLVQGRANQIDDLTSLVYVAFKFLFGYLPWERDKSVEKDPKLINKVSFAALRHKKKAQFIKDLHNHHSPFKNALKYLEQMSNQWKEFRRRRDGANPSTELELDYQKIINLIPNYSEGNYNKHKNSFLNTVSSFVNEHSVTQNQTFPISVSKEELIHALGVIQGLKIQGKENGELASNQLLTVYRSPVYLMITSLAGFQRNGQSNQKYAESQRLNFKK